MSIFYFLFPLNFFFFFFIFFQVSFMSESLRSECTQHQNESDARRDVIWHGPDASVAESSNKLDECEQRRINIILVRIFLILCVGEQMSPSRKTSSEFNEFAHSSIRTYWIPLMCLLLPLPGETIPQKAWWWWWKKHTMLSERLIRT